MQELFTEFESKSGKPLTETQRYWLEHYQKYHADGKSMAAYAREHGLSLTTFYSWSKQIRAWQSGNQEDHKQSVQFHPVRLTSDELSESSPGLLTLFVRLPNGTECEFRPISI